MRAEARASSRALVLLSTVLDVPVLASATRKATPRPLVETIELGGVGAERLRPPGDGPWPAFDFLNGAHPERRREPVVRRLTDGLARGGFLVLVPDPPGLAEGEITRRTLEASVEAISDAIARPEVRGGSIALLGASTGASLGLLAAARPRLANAISVVIAVAPFADLEKILCLATTSAYDDEGLFTTYEVDALLRRVALRSMVAALDESDRRTLVAAIEDAEEDRPLDVPGTADLSPEGRAVADLLVNREPRRFRNLCAQLPSALRTELRELSPLTVAASVRAPVELVVPPRDVYFPPSEPRALARALPNARLTVTRTLDHTRPTVSRRAMRDLAHFVGFVVRGLAHADA